MANFSECHLAVNYAYTITSIAARGYLPEIQMAVVIVTSFLDTIVQWQRSKCTFLF